MALPSTLYRFKIDLSDVDRGLYEALDFRVAMHPSETVPFLVTRVIAYALNVEPSQVPGLEFAPGGLSDSDEPCLCARSPNGGMSLWIEIGNPSARKLHKASKASARVRVYTYKDPALIVKEAAQEHIHRADEIDVFSFVPGFLDAVGKTLQRENRWSLMVNDGAITLTIGDRIETSELVLHGLTPAS